MKISGAKQYVFKRSFLIMLFLLALAPMSGAQEARPWSAWLFNPVEGSITEVRTNGEIIGAFRLPLAQAFNAYGDHILVSPGGRYIAFTAFDSTLADPNIQLFVYDRQIGATRFTYDLSGAIATGFELVPDQAAFDEQNGQFAFGILTQTGWRLVIGDFTSNTVLAELTPDQVEQVVQLPGGSSVPAVRNYDGKTVFFTLMAYGTEVVTNYPAFRWDIGTREIIPNTVYNSAYSDTLHGVGEVVIPASNDGWPAANHAEGSSVVLNTLDIAASPNGPRFTVYNADDVSLIRAIFIENGMRVLAQTFNLQTDESSLRVLDRDGVVVGELVGSLQGIRGTPDGFVGLFRASSGPALAHVNTRSNNYTLTTVWTGADVGVKLVHIQTEGQPPGNLPPWAQLSG